MKRPIRAVPGGDDAQRCLKGLKRETESHDVRNLPWGLLIARLKEMKAETDSLVVIESRVVRRAVLC